ncbi:organic cation transporter protein [Lepeophtheirus salmonis]|nr:organic cation transporter protein-like [Lepeophtheirus salmonis]
MKSNESKDKLLSTIGLCGKWQLIYISYVALITLPTVWPSLNIKFLAFHTDYWCERPNDFEDLSLWKNISSPYKLHDGKNVRDSCLLYEDPLADHAQDNRTIKCTKWEYDQSYFNNTIIQEWNLVCDRDYLSKLSQTIYFAGLLVGVFLSGIISDKFGRKKALVPMTIGMATAGVVMVFSNSIELFLFWRFVHGLATIGVFAVCFVWCMELVGGKWSTIVGMGLEFPWVAGWLLLGLFAHCLGDWRGILLITSIPTFLTASVIWVLPESPRWLISVNRVEEAEVTIRRIVQFNTKKPLPDDWKYNSTDSAHKEKSNTSSGKCLSAAFRSKSLILKALILFFNWFTNSFVYYGLTLNTSSLGGSVMLNFMVNGLLEIPAYSLATWVLLKSGRKTPYVIMMLLTGIFLLLTTTIPRNVYANNWPHAVCAILGKFCITGSFAISYIYTAEMYPTLVRSMGIGTSSLFARVGGIVAPFVGGLDKVVSPTFPIAIFGLTAILAAGLASFLPETGNKDMPDTVEDSEKFPLSLSDGFSQLFHGKEKENAENINL